MTSFEFNEKILPYVPDLIPPLFANKSIRGDELVSGSADDEPGESFNFNLKKGLGYDHATGERFNSEQLIARRLGISEEETREQFSERCRLNGNGASVSKLRPASKKSETIVAIPPTTAPLPPMIFRGRKADQYWTYRNENGETLFYISRHNFAPGEKEFCPWTWNGHTWKSKAWPAPRPLYNLDKLAKFKDRAVLVVEGERACDAAREIVGERYVCVSWCGGAAAWYKTDWAPLHGRNVTLWPDADDAGLNAMKGIAKSLHGKCPSVDIVDVSEQPDKWDLADTDWDWRKFAEFAAPRTRAFVDEIAAVDVETRELSEESELRPIEYSDDVVTCEFSARHANDLRFVPEIGWLQWDSTRWKKVPDVVVMQLARIACRTIAARAVDDPSLTLQKRENVAKAIASANTVAAVVKLARGDTRHFLSIEKLDADLWLFNTPIGTVDLKTGTLRPHCREDYITKIANAAPRGDCPRWHSFLERVTDGNTEPTAYLKRLCGYSLAGDPSEECLDFFHGCGANGKGTFLDVLQFAMGEYATTASTDTFTETRSDKHPTDLAKLAGARLVVAQEVDEGRRWDESRIKSLTGRDVISARFMRKDFFDFRPQFTLIIAGNHKPGLKTVDEAIKRRFHLVPFGVSIPPEERDPNLKAALRAEADGILAWAVQGCLDWQREGLSPPEIVLNATSEYLGDEDTFSLWKADCCQENPETTDQSGSLYESFSRWKKERGEGVPSHKKFSGMLKDRGFKLDRTGKTRICIGLRLTAEERAKLSKPQNEYNGRWNDG